MKNEQVSFLLYFIYPPPPPKKNSMNKSVQIVCKCSLDYCEVEKGYTTVRK